MLHRRLLTCALFFVVGCNSSEHSVPVGGAAAGANQTTASGVTTAPQAAANDAGPTEKTTAAAGAITLVVATAEEYAEVIKKHKGKIVLVDFWATWCTPCVKQFPHTVAISKKYADDVAVVSVSLDIPETDQKRVLAFLKSKGAAFDNLISALGAGEESAVAFDIEAGVPHYKIYDREGQLIASLSSDPEAPPLPEVVDLKLHELLADQ